MINWWLFCLLAALSAAHKSSSQLVRAGWAMVSKLVVFCQFATKCMHMHVLAHAHPAHAISIWLRCALAGGLWDSAGPVVVE